MNFLKKLNLAPLEDELLRRSLARSIESSQQPDKIDPEVTLAGFLDKLGNAISTFADEKYVVETETKENMQITQEDFGYIVEKLRHEGIITQQGVKQIIMHEKMAKREHEHEHEFHRSVAYNENFLERAARKAQSSPPLIRIDEWNMGSGKWHKHGIFTMDDEAKNVMDTRCQTQTSPISDVLNNSYLTVSIMTSSLVLDTNDDLFEEDTPETKSKLERSASRSFLLTVSQSSNDGSFESKRLVVTIEDETHDKVGNFKEYKDDNVSLRNIHSMRLPSKRFSDTNRLVSVREISFEQIEEEG